MEDCEDSEDDDIKDSDSFFAYTTTSSSLTASESGSEDNNTEESDDNQYTDVHLAATAEDFLMPPKRARTTGGPSRNSNQWKDDTNIVKQIQFTADPSLKINMGSEKPLDFFRLFVTKELINTMVVETNRKKFPTKPCQVCSKIKLKETRYECAVCENRPPLCIGECFRMYHSAE